MTCPPKCRSSPRPLTMRTPSTKSRAEPDRGAARPGKPGRNAAAERGVGAEVGRFEGQHLAACPPALFRLRAKAFRRARSSPVRWVHSRRCRSVRACRAHRRSAPGHRNPCCRCRGCATASARRPPCGWFRKTAWMTCCIKKKNEPRRTRRARRKGKCNGNAGLERPFIA